MHYEHPRVVVASGGFDPLHSGHIEYLKEAKLLGDRLIVALASDHALIQKKNAVFLGWEDRKSIIKSLKMVDEVIVIDDYYDHYQSALTLLRKRFPNTTIIFASGNDKTKYNNPNLHDQNVEFKYNVGGERINRSRTILRTYADYVRNVQELEAGPNGRY